MRISTPGFHEIAAADYHADPCPDPSLSSSIASWMIERSPLHAWSRHPRLNPECIVDRKKIFDRGSAVHKLTLGAGADIRVIDADSYRSKDAQTARDQAYETGQIPMLADDMTSAHAMADIGRATIQRLLGSTGIAEQVMVWREGETWCRSMVDIMRQDRTVIIDLKTTSASAAPADARRRFFSEDYSIQAAFIERGLNALDPENAGRRKIIYLFQETDEPYACCPIEVGEGVLHIGRKKVAAAIKLWSACMKANVWPGYPLNPVRADPPSWWADAWENKQIEEAEYERASAAV